MFDRTRGYRKRHVLLGEAQTADAAPDTADRVPLEVRRSRLRRAFVPISGQGGSLPHLAGPSLRPGRSRLTRHSAGDSVPLNLGLPIRGSRFLGFRAAPA